MRSTTHLKKGRNSQVERYDIGRSPLAERPTQRDIASLLGESRDDLRRLINYKEYFIVRRQIISGKRKKLRDLAYPEGRLRCVHEKLKFHLNKIKQPSYLFSPRRNKSQRDNALRHLKGAQYLTIDLKQFYPSTTDKMVKKWLISSFFMQEDVAGLLAHICTIDGRVSFGSPLTPVLCSLIHRPMFDEIAEVCDRRGLRYSVWVDDLTISGKYVPGEVLNQIREIVRKYGLRSHKIAYRSGSRPVFITGIGIVGSNLVAPNSLNLKIKTSWEEYHAANTDDEKDSVAQQLLSYLGTLRYIVGRTSDAGCKTSNQMNSLRQERTARDRAAQSSMLGQTTESEKIPPSIPMPWA